MKNELDLWIFIQSCLNSQKAVMLLVVAASSGSSPGRPGFKMAVSADDLVGSIGGGVMEVRLVNEARDVIRSQESGVRSQETEIRSQESGGRSQETVVRSQETGVRGQETGVRSQESGDGSQQTGDSSQESGNRSQEKGDWGSADQTLNVAPETSNPEQKKTGPSLIRQVHRANSNKPSGMICSGEQTVLRLILTPDDLVTVETIAKKLQAGGNICISITETGLGICEGRDLPSSHEFIEGTEGEFVYREVSGRRAALYIVGGGHCALALSEVMSRLGFYISLFDDRAELNTIEKNNFAEQITLLEDYEGIREYIPPGNDTYVVVMTIGYKFDDLVIRLLLGREFRYFGVLGSKAKMARLLRELRESGFPEDEIARIRTPIGVSINSRTPEEIAVSIAAEIIAVKNSKG